MDILLRLKLAWLVGFDLNTNFTLPTGALNKSAAVEVVAELLKLNREGMSILMVTHDSKVASTCDRIMYLLDGSIRGELALGKLEAVWKNSGKKG